MRNKVGAKMELCQTCTYCDRQSWRIHTINANNLFPRSQYLQTTTTDGCIHQFMKKQSLIYAVKCFSKAKKKQSDIVPIWLKFETRIMQSVHSVWTRMPTMKTWLQCIQKIIVFEVILDIIIEMPLNDLRKDRSIFTRTKRVPCLKDGDILANFHAFGKALSIRIRLLKRSVRIFTT